MQQDERHRALDIVLAASRQACSAVDDEMACEELRDRISRERAASDEAIGLLGARRDNFVEDRAYRLLTAAVQHTLVRPIDRSVEALFREEELLGRMPLSSAYGRLANLEPRLESVRGEVASGRWRSARHAAESELSEYVSDRLEDLVGIGARSSEPLVRSDLADSIAQQYLLILGGDEGYGDADVAFFDQPAPAWITSSGSGATDRPKARN